VTTGGGAGEIISIGMLVVFSTVLFGGVGATGGVVGFGMGLTVVSER
jgi:hypothetical protein